jgi:hypothetical protein
MQAQQNSRQKVRAGKARQSVSFGMLKCSTPAETLRRLWPFQSVMLQWLNTKTVENYPFTTKVKV